MRLRRQGKRWAAAAASALTITLLPPASAWASPQEQTSDQTSVRKDPAAPESGKTDNDPSKVTAPDSKLPKGWRTSDDRAVTAVGDAQGLHVLVADSAQAYQWREAATLREDGFDADAWIGNVCVTGSGKRAVVAYAPRTFTNRPALFDRGAFAAVIDLDKNTVTKLRQQVSLAYFNPGCGAGEDAVLTQAADEELGKTRLLRVDTATAKVTHTLTVRGEATSAVPVGKDIVAALGNRLTRVHQDGSRQLIATTSGPAFHLHPDSTGAVAFLDRKANRADLKRAAGSKVTTLAHGKLGTIGLSPGTKGRLFLTGDPKGVSSLPSGIRQTKADASAVLSSRGQLAVNQAVSTGLRSHVTDPLATPGDDDALPYKITAQVPATGKKLAFTVPGASTGRTQKQTPALASTKAGTAAVGKSLSSSRTATATLQAAAASSASPQDPERTCSIARNDQGAQALQPTPNQVEWAVDMAIRGNLTSGYITQGGWRAGDSLGSSVSPSTMFPLPALKGAPAGSRIPAQVLLGVLAQESNLWQASYHALPGQTGNPLVGNFYGTNIYPGTPGYDPNKIWSIDWTKADCGYGIGQQTDGMSIAARQQPGKPGAFPADQQRAIALDYTANVAVAAQTLAKKWNELHTDGQTIKINDDDPKYLENWFAAAWNYNLGYNTPDSTGKWGLGWLNNPANPKYPADRFAFLDNNHYADAAQPQKWPYPEKVMGWAAYPIDTGRSYSDAGAQDNGNTHGFQAAWWGDAGARTRVKPSLDTFCNSSNGCDSGNPPQCTTEACYKQYWYHANAKWKTTCSIECGNETLTYKTLRAELGRGNSGQPNCSTGGLPAGALIIDDVPASAATLRSDCSKSWTNNGKLDWEFKGTSGTNGTTYEGKEDFHQIGGGFGAHFWFAHTRDDQHRIDPMRVTGTWTLDKSLNQWARVLVHLPDTGAETQQAHYTIDLGNGTRHRYLNQRYRSNTWVPLGTYRFAGTPKVSLDNQADDGTADNDVAWDAIAIQPLSAKPNQMVVAMGDSYTSGEGAGDYSKPSDTDHGKDTWNACRRSANAWPRKVTLAGNTDTVGALADKNDPSLDFQFVACSGAETWQLTQGNPVGTDGKVHWGWDGNFHEKSQIDSGVLSADTTLVMLTIGGNDAEFDKKIEACVVSGCPSEASMKTDIDAAVAGTKNVLEQIHTYAPTATIALMGYPLLFSPTEACSTVVSASQRVILNNMAQYFEDKQRALALSLSSSGVTFKSPQNAFNGKRVCDAQEGINGIVAGPNGDGDFHHGDDRASCWWFWADSCFSRESYHPNKLGTTTYANAFMQMGPSLTARQKRP